MEKVNRHDFSQIWLSRVLENNFPFSLKNKIMASVSKNIEAIPNDLDEGLFFFLPVPMALDKLTQDNHISGQ